MARLVRIRDVPEPVHRTLKSRAAQSGMSLSAYLRRELARIASLRTSEELLERLHSRKPVSLPDRKRPAVVIRKHRGPLH